MNKVGSVALEGFWLPKATSSLAGATDGAWEFVYWVSVFFFVLVVGAQAIFMVKFRRRTAHDKTSTLDHHTGMEIAWTVAPSMLCVVLFVVGFQGYLKASVSPADAMEVNVTAAKWSWTFTYPNGVESASILRVPVNRPVRLIMSSTDVIHSFYVPEYRIKSDVVPGTYTTVWFKALTEGNHQIFCTEYCGTLHSDMLGQVVVMPEADFKAWLEKEAMGGDLPPEKLGEKLFATKGCSGCHSITGAKVVGPPLNGLFGRDEQLAGGGTAKVDESYLRESMLNPAAKVVLGYEKVPMTPFQGLLDDAQINALIAYIKSLK